MHRRRIAMAKWSCVAKTQKTEPAKNGLTLLVSPSTMKSANNRNAKMFIISENLWM